MAESVSVPAPVFVRPAVPAVPVISPANVVEFASPTDSVLRPSMTTDPVEPESAPIDRLDAVIPAMSNVAPLAATLTVPVVASEPAWATDRVPVLIVVLPV